MYHIITYTEKRNVTVRSKKERIVETTNKAKKINIMFLGHFF